MFSGFAIMQVCSGAAVGGGFVLLFPGLLGR